ncbi:MAG: carboxypeptidase regulatory-like domain-containing protein [Acidobacteria bacterium]|nr:carboxypeptidase regulatory-like domain-containing protein [Acidobacteriota bacterium]
MSVVMLLAALLLQAPADEPRGSISGRFVSAQTGEPLRGVSVQMSGLIDGQFWRQATLSAGDGTFSFGRLRPGAYSLDAEKTGYRPAAWPNPITLEKDQSRTGIEIKMNRAAVITGRVTDVEGRPVMRAEVSAYRFRWLNGRRTVARLESAATDDRGVYRMYGLPAGRYVVGAMPPSEEMPAGEDELRAVAAYYPFAVHPAEAAVLEVRWGQELPEIDVVFRPQASYAVSGVVADAETGGPCRSCVLRAIPLDAAYGFAQRQFGVAPDGRYRLRGLPPGAYKIVAEKMERPGRHLVSSRTVQVTNRDLRDVHLVAGVGHTVSGRIVWESRPPEEPKGEMVISLAMAEGTPLGGTARVGPDLAFEVGGIAAETYSVRLRGMPPGGYLKAVRVGGQDLPAPEIEVPEEGALSPVEVVVGFDSATLSGVVKPPEQGHRVTAAMIALFPQENQSAFVVERRASTDANGAFSLTGIPPGAYTVFALPIPAVEDWGDPEVRRRLQSYGKSVDLGAGKKQTVELVLAPAASEPQ